MKFMSFFSRFGKSWRRRTARRRPSAVRPHAVLIGVEELETRTLLSVLPPAIINGQSTFGSGISPQVVVDPVNPQKVVAVASTGADGYTLLASADGGYDWTTVVDPTILIPPPYPFYNIPDPQISAGIVPRPYTENTDATVTMDRSEQIYVVMSQHNAAYTSGAIILVKFDFSVSDPALITQTIGTEELGGSTGVNDEVLYQWDGADAAYNPTIAIDNNVASYTDPQTGFVQTDSMATMHVAAANPTSLSGGFGGGNLGVNPFAGAMVPKAIYVAWNTVNTAPAVDTRFPNPLQADMNGVVQAIHPFNPNTIKVIASADGASTFTTQEFVNDPSFVVGDPNYNDGPAPINSYNASSPQIAFTQGTANGVVPGGEMVVVWNDITNVGGYLVDTSLPDQGVASVAAAATYVVNSNGPPIQIRDATVAGAVGGGGALPDIPGITNIPINVNITDPNFDKLADISVNLAIYAPHMDQLQISLISPSGQQVILLNNYTDSLGKQANTQTGVRAFGLPNVGNLGIEGGYNPNGGPSGAQIVGTTFDQQAARPINDLGATSPYIGLFRPDDLAGQNEPGSFQGSGLNMGGLELFDGLPPLDPTGNGNQLNGTWTLQIIDNLNDRLGANGMAPNFNQFVESFSVNFTARISTTQFGVDSPLFGLDTIFFAPPAANDVPGSATNVYPNKPAVSPTTGVGPSFSLAVDNTLGSFSPFQGRIYVAATVPGVNSLLADDTDILLAYSDDGGATWTTTKTDPATGVISPLRINDDTLTDSTEGDRPQFMPTLAVDQATGTLVATYYDARNDAARARSVTSIQTSIDGGVTWSPSTYLNAAQIATDAITGKTITVGPIPTNIAAAGALGIGDRQGLAVYGGKVYAFWSGNLNAGGHTITTADVTIAAGPRVVSGDEGPVAGAGASGTYNNTFTNDGTRQLTGFEVQFDRPVDPATVSPTTVQVQGPTGPVQVTSVTPLDVNTAPNPPAVSIGNAIVLEGPGAALVFPVLLSTVQTANVVLDVSVADLTAVLGVNYGAPTSGPTVTILAGSNSAFITVPIINQTALNDTLGGTGLGTLAVNISVDTFLSPPGIVLARGQAIGTIVDDNNALSLSVGDGIALKGGPGTTMGMLFQVILNQPYFQDVTVHYATSDGTAKAGVDYVATQGFVTIPAGSTQALITVPIIGNQVFSNNLTFSLTIDTPPVGIGITRPTGTGIIVNDVTLYPLTVNVGDAIVDKTHSGTTPIYFPVILSIPQTTAVVANYTTANGTAVAGKDYVAASGSVTFLPGQTTATITVQVIGNTLATGNETFLVNLVPLVPGPPPEASDNVVLGRSQAVGTIVDSNSAPAVSVGNSSVAEPANGTASMFFPVYLSTPSNQPVTVTYATADNTAVAGVDYTAASGTLIIPPGQITGTITVQVPASHMVENDTTFFVNLTAATNATIATAQAVGTIVGSGLGLTVGDASVFEGPQGSQSMLLFPVFLSGTTGATVTVNYATQDIAGAPNAAVGGVDYVPASGTLTIPAGQTSGTITVLVNGDFITNPANKIFFVNLSNPVNASLIRKTAVGTIVDDDAVPNLTVGSDIEEAPDLTDVPPTNNALVPIFLSYALPAGDDVTVSYTTTDGTAFAGIDYTATVGTVTIPGGSTSATLTIPLTATPSFEKPDLNFTVNLIAVTTDIPGTMVPNAAIAGPPAANFGTGTVTIVHDGVSANIDDTDIVNPGNGTVNAIFNIYLSGARGKMVTVNWATANGSGMAGVDYVAANGVVAFLPGQTVQQVTVTVNSAPTTTSDKTFFVNLSNIVNADPRAAVSKVQGEGIIFHIDGQTVKPPLPVQLSIGNVTELEGNIGLTPFVFPVEINQPPAAAVTVNYTVFAGSAFPGVDFIPVNGMLTFAAGSTAIQNITVNVRGNAIDNQVNPNTSGNRNFFVVLQNPKGAALAPGFGQGTGVIIDDDSLTASIGDATVLKPQNGTTLELFPVLLSNAPQIQPVNLTYSTANIAQPWAAKTPLDYQAAVNQTLTIPLFQTTGTITVTVNGNTLIEGNTQFAVNMPQAGASGAAVIKSQGLGTIVDQNTIALTIGDVFSPDGPVGGTTNMVFPVYLNSASSTPITVQYATQDGSAVSTGTSPDYQAAAGTLTFAPGTTLEFITVLANGDAATEPNKQFTVNLVNPSGAGLLKPVGVGTIVSDDVAPSLTIGDASVLKATAGHTSNMVFPVYLSAPVAQSVTVVYSTADGTATVAEGDYVPVVNGTVMIPAGAISAFITVTVNGDNIAEGNENFKVNISTSTAGIGIELGTGTGLIVDNNAVPTVNIGDAILDKSSSTNVNAVFPVLLSAPFLGGVVTVNYTTADDSAVANTNYLPTSGTLTFAPGQLTAFITVSVLPNSIQEGTKDFFVNLSNVVDATMGKQHGVGTIIDDTGKFGASLYLVNIAPQSTVGTYSYAVGPFVSDRIRTDVPTIVAVPGTNATVYVPPLSQINNNLAVPNIPATKVAPIVPAHTDSTLSISGVPASQVIRDMTVNLSINYPELIQAFSATLPQESSLEIDLVAPGGAVAVGLSIHNPVGPLAPYTVTGTFFNTTFDDLAALPISSYKAQSPFDGSFKPDNPLSAFNGLNPNGTWTLAIFAFNPITGVSDPLGTGVLQTWSMDIQTGVLRPNGQLGNFMDQDTNSMTVDQVRSPADIFAAPAPVNGVPTQVATTPLKTMPDGTTAFTTAAAPFQLPFTSNSLPLIIPGPHAVPLTFATGSQVQLANAQPLNLAIPDATVASGNLVPGTLNSTIQIADVPIGQVISNLTVTVAIDHTKVSDLILTLIAPDGQQVVLSNRNPQGPGPSGTIDFLPGVNFDSVTFDDSALLTINVPSTAPKGTNPVLPPFNGTFQPQTPLSVLNGTSLNGTWTLKIQDLAVGNTGILLGWSLQATDGEVLNTSASSVDVNFNQLMNPATFTPANVLSIIGPAGPVPLTGISVVPLLPNGVPDPAALTSPNPTPEHAFRIFFPTQTVSGNYSVQIGPNPSTNAYITSVSGNKVDTNLNAGLLALEGEDTTSSALVPVTTPTPAGQTTVLPSGQLTLIPIKVTSNFVVQGATVALNISHSYDPDLTAVLYAPDGTPVKLFTQVGPAPGQPGSTTNFTNTILSDSARTINPITGVPTTSFNPISGGGAPFSGTYNPQEPLSALDGMSSLGTWYLGIENNVVAGHAVQGVLINWSLTLLQSPVTSTGLGEPVADQVSAGFQIFIADPTNPLSRTQWTPVGPQASNTTTPVGAQTNNAATGAGRVSAIAVDPSDPSGNTVYIGAASGGVWKTTNFLTTSPLGPNWVPLTNFGPTYSLNIGAITVIPRNNNPANSIIIAATGEGSTQSPGVGFLRSEDGGQTWVLLDSLVNVNLGTNAVLPINDPGRNHQFVGTTAYQLTADIPDASKFPTAPVVLYAALGNTPATPAAPPITYILPSTNNGGIYRSTDLGNTWTLVQPGNATSVQLAPGSVDPATGNAQGLFAAIEGQGVYYTNNAIGASSMNLLNNFQQDNLIRNDANVFPDQAIQVAPPPKTPNGALGRITLAVPAATGNPLLDSFYQQWVYALVANPAGTMDGLFMSKDFGRTWTQVMIPSETAGGITLGVPTNDFTQPNYDPLADAFGFFPMANYNTSITADPSNPNIVYVGGVDYDQPPGVGGVIRVDTTTISDPYALVPYNNSKKDGGLTMFNTTGAATVIVPGALFGVADPLSLPPYAPPNEESYQGEDLDLVTGAGTQTGGYFNLQRNPQNPFLTNATVRVEGINLVPGFTNTGQGATWVPFEPALPGTASYQTVVAVKDPITGDTRVLFGTSAGVYTEVDDGSGGLETGIGSATDVNGNRNGNLQITQFFYGAAQPSELAAELAGALFYGSAQESGAPQSTGNVLQTGNLTWTGSTVGSATGVATDPQGSGTLYQYSWPINAIRNGPGSQFTASDFFQVTPAGGTPHGATNGLVLGTNNPSLNVGQWPLPIFPVGSSFTQPPGGAAFFVNPVDGQAIVMSAPDPGNGLATGEVYLTTNGGAQWFAIAQPSQLDGSYSQAMAFGAPNPNDPTHALNNFIYVGTQDGHVYVTFSGGGTGAPSPWVNITGAGLDGSAIQAIVPDTHPGSKDVYLVTLKGVYFLADSSVGAPVWTNITGNLFNVALTRPLFNNPTQAANSLTYQSATGLMDTYLTSLVADWRYAIPNNPAQPNGATHPVLYVAGEAGVFRSLDNGNTWNYYPNTAEGATQNGGYLPNVHVTELSLAVGNINPTTGQPTNQATGFNMLVATTYGQGMFEIRLNSTDMVDGQPLSHWALAPVEGPYVVSAGLASTTGSVSAINVTFSGPVDPSTFTIAKILQLTGPAGNSIPVLGVNDVTPNQANGTNLHNMYQILFPAQTTPGVYTITFGPNISDFAGNQMDQNRNNINGEVTTPAPSVSNPDAFTGHFFFGTVATPPAVPDIVTMAQQNGQWWVGQPNGNTGMTFTQFGQWAVQSAALTWVNVHVGDFNGDGIDDIIGMVQQTGQWWVGISNGGHFTNQLWATWAPYTATFQWQDVIFGDFNGDGKMDIAGRESGSGKWWVATSTGHSFNTSFWGAWSPNTPGKFDWTNVMVGDFNGDGKADIVGQVLETGQWWVNISTGSAFVTKFWGAWTPDTANVINWVDVNVGDFNGDGKADIIGRNQVTGQWWVNFSTGSVFYTKFYDQWASSVTWLDVKVGDFNGDGLSDIIGLDGANGQWFVSRSVLTNGATTLWTSWAPDIAGVRDYVDVEVGDFNGDGKTDLIAKLLQTGQWFVSLANNNNTGSAPALWAVLSPNLSWIDTSIGKVG